MSDTTRYGVKLLKEKMILTIMGQEQEINLSFAEGMMGVIPIFDTKENALKYAKRHDSNYTINNDLFEIKVQRD